MDSQASTRDALAYLRTTYPIVLLITFIVAFIANSIFAAKKVSQNGRNSETGPGGRPLPKRSRSTMAVVKKAQTFSWASKLLFRWLSVGILLTLVADAAINMTHVILAKSEHWWCGQSVVVSLLEYSSYNVWGPKADGDPFFFSNCRFISWDPFSSMQSYSCPC